MARRRRDRFNKNRQHNSRRRRIILRVLLGLGVFLLLLFIAYQQLLSYLQGDSFRQSLEEDLCNKARAESVTLDDNLDIDGNRLSLAGARLERRGLLSHLSARHISAELDRGALFDRILQLDRIHIENATLTLDAARINEQLPPVEKSEESFWSRFTPNQTLISGLSCKQFSTCLKLGEQRYDLAACELSATAPAGQQEGEWQFKLTGGKLHTPLPWLRDSAVKSVDFTLADGRYTLRQARLMLSPGELILSARYNSNKKQWSAGMRVNKADVTRLLREDWKKKLSGELYGKLDLSGNSKGLQQASGTIALQQACIEALPHLSDIPLDGTYPYRSLKLEKATANITYPYSDSTHNIRRAWLIDNIELRGRGDVLRAHGHIIINEDGTLSGTIVAGLPERILDTPIPLFREFATSLFSAKGDPGFIWVNINISGTTDAPLQDLSERVSTLMSKGGDTVRNALFSLLPGSNTRPADKDREQPAADSNPTPAAPTPGSILDGAGKAAGDIISTGLDSIF